MNSKYLLITLISAHVSLFAEVPLLKKEPKTAGIVSHTTRQMRPIPLGVSGGSTVDFANGYCCSGTLGALVQDTSGVIYILSNTHVFAGDTVIGGNGKKSAKGDPINQPGFVDVNCQTKTADFIGTLERWIPLVANGVSSVDAAIAKTTQTSVNSQGTILEIGTISKTPKLASIGQKVKKSGRTSGLTRGSIIATNATISVQYTKECAGGAFTTTFKNQILISPGTFIRPGDSGSLLVEDITTNPKAIGLLFAGSSTVAVANPIQNVLNALHVSLVGVATPTLDASHLDLTRDFETARASSLVEKHSSKLLKLPGVVGHAIGSDDNDETPLVYILVESAANVSAKTLPKEVEGLPVKVMEIGKVVAY